MWGGAALHADETKFDPAAERKRLLELAEIKRPQALVLKNLENASPEKRAFLEFYRDRLWPKVEELTALGIRLGAYSVAFDRALFKDNAEKDLWSQEIVNISNKYDAITNGKEWKDLIKQWRDLSVGLDGELARFARKSWETIELGAFSDEMLPSLARLRKLEQDVSDLANNIPSAAKRPEAEEKISQAASDFKAGKISVNEATARIEAAENDGDIAFGKELATKGLAALNELAILRTKLAQSKGYKNWAEYRLATAGRNYAAPYNTVEGQVQFLKDLLTLTQPAFDHFLAERAKEMKGVDSANWRTSQIDHLLSVPSDVLVRDYFPRELGEKKWREAMLENGFSAESLSHIRLDSLPRPGKMNHGGYMNPVTFHSPKNLMVDAESLNLEIPVDTAENFYPSEIEIVQNLRTDGPEGHGTAKHEGGHALHFAFEVSPLEDDKAYGYVEVHSMMMERFETDLAYLLRTAKKRDGSLISQALAETYIRNANINKLIELRTLASRALFELRLWGQAYAEAEGVSSYVEVSKRLWVETMGEGLSQKAAPSAEYDWGNYSFVRPHFRSAWVQYSGYVFASVGAGLVGDVLLDIFEKETARRTFDLQPTMASKLIPFYRDGWRKPFPASVEDFTKKKFSVKDFANSVGHDAANYRAN